MGMKELVKNKEEKNAIHIQESRLAQGRAWKQTIGGVYGFVMSGTESPFFYEADG